MILDLENQNLKVLDFDESEGSSETMIFLGGGRWRSENRKIFFSSKRRRRLELEIECRFGIRYCGQERNVWRSERMKGVEIEGESPLLTWPFLMTNLRKTQRVGFECTSWMHHWPSDPVIWWRILPLWHRRGSSLHWCEWSGFQRVRHRNVFVMDLLGECERGENLWSGWKRFLWACHFHRIN